MLIAAFIALPALRGAHRVLACLAIALLALRVLFYARWWSWYGGDVWGPRYLVPVLPAFAPALAVALDRWPRSRWLSAGVAATVALSLVGLWVTVHPDLNPYVGRPVYAGTTTQIMAQFTDPAYVRQTDDRMFDWTKFPFRG